MCCGSGKATQGSTAPGIAARGDENSRSGAGSLCCAGSRGLAMQVMRGVVRRWQRTGQTAVKADMDLISTAIWDQLTKSQGRSVE